jgi:hypothetical protein
MKPTCNACCYDYNKNSLCRYQEIRNGKSHCSMHEDPRRDILCQNWFCSDWIIFLIIQIGKQFNKGLEI